MPVSAYGGVTEGIGNLVNLYGTVKGFERDKQEAAYRAQTMQQQAALAPEHLQQIKQENQIRELELAAAKRKEEALNRPISIETFDKLKKETPDFYNEMDKRAKDLGFYETIGGKTIIREGKKQELLNAMNTDHQFFVAASTALDRDLARKEDLLSGELDDLKSKVKLDKRGNPVSNDKLTGEIAAKSGELKGIQEHRTRLLGTIDETFRKKAIEAKTKAEADMALERQKETVRAAELISKEKSRQVIANIHAAARKYAADKGERKSEKRANFGDFLLSLRETNPKITYAEAWDKWKRAGKNAPKTNRTEFGGPDTGDSKFELLP